ncbi:MAG: HAD family hydrolase [Bacilli bacterium]|nr:HAD family hydrolase [Bacilli bacterium]
MYKLIVSDFDGTLIDKEGRIPLSTVLLLDDLRRKKIKIAIATGRCLKSVLDYNKDFTICDYLITSNGAYIYDISGKSVIFRKNIGIRTVKKIIKEFSSQAIIYLTDHNTWNLISKKGAYSKEFDVVKVLDQEKFLEENKTNIYKIELYFETLLLAKNCLKQMQELNLRIHANLQTNEGKYLVEITYQEISKLKGVEKILSKYKWSLDDVIVFGDGYNDIELMKKAGLGVAVSSAIEEVKKAADDITLDSNQKGVEKYLRSIFK